MSRSIALGGCLVDKSQEVSIDAERDFYGQRTGPASIVGFPRTIAYLDFSVHSVTAKHPSIDYPMIAGLNADRIEPKSLFVLIQRIYSPEHVGGPGRAACTCGRYKDFSRRRCFTINKYFTMDTGVKSHDPSPEGAASYQSSSRNGAAYRPCGRGFHGCRIIRRDRNTRVRGESVAKRRDIPL
jgi:hypothetical protein